MKSDTDAHYLQTKSTHLADNGTPQAHNHPPTEHLATDHELPRLGEELIELSKLKLSMLLRADGQDTRSTRVRQLRSS